MAKLIDLSNKKFGRLTVIRRAKTSKSLVPMDIVPAEYREAVQ